MLPRLPELTWPEALLGPPPHAREVRVACIGSIVFALLILVFLLVGGRAGVTAAGLGYREDFVAFYAVGDLLNSNPPQRLYDFSAQERAFLEVRPSDGFLTLPYVHAPFEALIFRPFALLPYESAYVAWLALSMLAYCVGLTLLIRRFGPKDASGRATVFLLACSFPPFLMEAWLGGNVSVIGFVALAVAVALEDAGRPMLSGFALAVCLNKPSLLVLILPMLLLSRRWVVLAGFTLGASTLVVSSSLVLGWQAWPDFVRTLLRWAQVTASEPGVFRDWKYVDLNAFFRLLPGGRSWLGSAAILAAAFLGLVGLLRLWLAVPRAGREGRCLAWAVTIAGTLVLNAYVPIYDCTLLVIAGITAAAALRDPADGHYPQAFTMAVALCILVAWATQPIARVFDVQLYTLVLIYVAAYLSQQFWDWQAGRGVTAVLSSSARR